MESSSRRLARERVLALLYEAELKAVAPSEVVASLAVPPDPYALEVLAAVEARSGEIDRLVDGAAIGWDIDRMAVVDRNVLRMAVAELLVSDGVPTAVILNEAVDLAAGYSTDESGRFVNGVLATLAARLRPGGDD